MHQPSMTDTKDDYESWLDEITQEVEALGMTRSDAQGVVQSQPFAVTQSWGMGLNPTDTAKKIIAAATPVTGVAATRGNC